MKYGEKFDMIKLVIKKKINILLQKYRIARKRHIEIRKFKDPKRIKIYSQIELTEKQKKQIDDFYLSNYGKKIPYTWHRYFTAFTGSFDPQYFPELLFIPEFERYMNPNQSYVNVFADKNVLAAIAAGVGVRMPKSVVSSVNNILLDKEYGLIDWNSLETLLGEGEYFAKPTVDSDSGRGCRLLDCKNNNMLHVLKKMGCDFVVQEKIVCSESISRLHPASVNTLRIMTYVWKEKIAVAPVIMRIGRNGSFLDNAHAGGMFIAVNNDGSLHKYAFTEFRERFYEHPDTKIIFEGYVIKNMEKVIKEAIRMHSALPQLGVINWDFTIDKNEEPILIEANTSGGSIWLFQIAWGRGVFGENTAEILQWMRGNRV